MACFQGRHVSFREGIFTKLESSRSNSCVLHWSGEKSTSYVKATYLKHPRKSQQSFLQVCSTIATRVTLTWFFCERAASEYEAFVLLHLLQVIMINFKQLQQSRTFRRPWGKNTRFTPAEKNNNKKTPKDPKDWNLKIPFIPTEMNQIEIIPSKSMTFKHPSLLGYFSGGLYSLGLMTYPPWAGFSNSSSSAFSSSSESWGISTSGAQLHGINAKGALSNH